MNSARSYFEKFESARQDQTFNNRQNKLFLWKSLHTLLFMTKTVAMIDTNELALYDRQVRLWGLTAQQKQGLVIFNCCILIHSPLRIRTGSVLLLQPQAPVAHEILKNIVLTGIGNVAINPISLDNATTERSLFGNVQEVSCPTFIFYARHGYHSL